MEILTHLEHFIAESKPNEMIRKRFFKTAEMELYVRENHRFLGGEFVHVLELGDIEVHQKRQGHFTRLMNALLVAKPFDGILIENIINPILVQWCIDQNWTLVAENESPSYYLLFEKKD